MSEIAVEVPARHVNHAESAPRVLRQWNWARGGLSRNQVIQNMWLNKSKRPPPLGNQKDGNKHAPQGAWRWRRKHSPRRRTNRGFRVDGVENHRTSSSSSSFFFELWTTGSRFCSNPVEL